MVFQALRIKNKDTYEYNSIMKVELIKSFINDNKINYENCSNIVIFISKEQNPLWIQVDLEFKGENYFNNGFLEFEKTDFEITLSKKMSKQILKMNDDDILFITFKKGF